MKVVTSQQMAAIESKAYQEGASEDDFMEEAGSGIALVVHEFAELGNIDRHAILFCGLGNNGGDAYVAGLHLLHLDYQVTAYQLSPISECSRLCQQNYHRFFQEGGRIIEVHNPSDVILPGGGIIIDGIFGTGFHGKVNELIASIVELLNNSELPIISIDIPSGLDGSSGVVEGKAIIATETAFLSMPKKGFFLMDGWDHVGKLRYVDFGLPKKFMEETDTDLIMLTTEELKHKLPRIKRSRHKYEAGYVVGLAGSHGMAGAAILSADAALRGGAGIVRLLHPAGIEVELAGGGVEILKTSFEPHEGENLLSQLNRASATFIGPGIGRKLETWDLLRRLLPRIFKPTVIDADALALVAEERDLILPEHTILTPHRGEMNHLLGLEKKHPFDRDYLKLCQEFVEQKRCTLVLKGGPTFILHPGEPMHVNPRGDPGMATAGSGDVLTGLLAALLAQGVPQHDAAMLGVYIHAIAGEFAAVELTSYSMAASDILYHFPEGFLFYDSASMMM